MFFEDKIWMAKNDEKIFMLPKMANRHGLIAGATGTGKTVTLKVMAESFSDAGVPVFVSDIKGDLSGMSQPGEDSESMQKRIEKFGLKEAGFTYKSYPTCYWDVFGRKGIPVRATISDMGPLLLARLMDLTAVQEGVLEIVFKVSDDECMPILDLKDLRAMLQHVADNAKEYKVKYGNVSSSSVGAIQRGLLKLENEGADQFFGEPALNINDWMRTDKDGRGMINVMNCEQLFLEPDLYAAFMLWMLSELYESLPEVGDLDKPKMVFFFDEAHLLFNLATKELLQKIEQVVRLIRSKGVGIFFITQNPADIPNTILSQLGNRIQHALHAYTPADMKGLKTAAESFRINPDFDTSEAIQGLGTGEAVVSFLDESGAPGIAQKASILPPASLMGPLEEPVIVRLYVNDEMYKTYGEVVDRESAYEILTAKIKAAEEAEAAEAARIENAKSEKAKNEEATMTMTEKEIARIKAEAVKEEKERAKKNELSKAAKSIATSAGRTAANKVVRGLLGSLFK